MPLLKHFDFEVPGFREFSAPPLHVPAYADAVLGMNPEAYWRLGEQAGSTLSDQTAGHPIALSGAFTLGQSGAIAGDPNTAVALSTGSGTTASPILPIASGAPFSVVFWIRASEAIASSAAFLGQYTAASTGHALFTLQADGVLRYELIGDTPLMSSTAIDTQWHMAVFTRSAAGEARWYLDGRLDAQIPGQTTAIVAAALSIGAVTGTSPDAELDELAVFDTDLSPEQIRWLHGLGAGELALPPNP